MDHEEFFSNLDALNASVYATINKDFLLAYAINLLLNEGIPTTFETIVVTSYKLFPESFSLIGFSQYPDAARINRALLHARPNYQNLVIGDAKRGYRLTKKGEYKAQEIAAVLKNAGKGTKNIETASNVESRTYRGKQQIDDIEASKLFKLWSKGKEEEISPYEFWFFLDVSPTTDRDTLNQIIDDYDQAAQLGKRDDIKKFIGWIKRRYSSQLRRDK